MTDTIYAPSTAIGGAIAIIRISGPEAGKAACILGAGIFAAPGTLRRTLIADGSDPVDDGMAVFFKAPHSYTGEDMVEIDCHGGYQSVYRIMDLLAGLGFRAADPGEFTRRAFENGKIDLSRAEAVMDVILAGSERSHRAAMRQLEGSVQKRVERLEKGLLEILAGMDAALDFPDEAGEILLSDLQKHLNAVREELSGLIRGSRTGRFLREGLRVVLLGRPNVGKSSLLNAFLEEERAIVTSIPGTTRDILEETVDLDGVPVRFVDTAGIRNTSDHVERIGVERARKSADGADLILLVLDGASGILDEDRVLLEETTGRDRILVINKIDLIHGTGRPDPMICPEEIRVSAMNGEGIPMLRREIAKRAGNGTGGEPVITNERHTDALRKALQSLGDATGGEDPELIATDIRQALRFLGEITGRDVDDSVIETIFARFCVGK